MNEGSYPTVKTLFDLASDFTAFKLATLEEMKRHYPQNGDSWKTCDIEWLSYLTRQSMREFIDDVDMENPSHLLDVANFCAMLWTRI